MGGQKAILVRFFSDGKYCPLENRAREELPRGIGACAGYGQDSFCGHKKRGTRTDVRGREELSRDSGSRGGTAFPENRVERVFVPSLL